MNLEYSKGILFVRLDGKLNRKTSYKINNYLVPVILKHKIKKIVYNFLKLTDVDECGIDAILNTESAVKNNHGALMLCELNKLISKKLKKIKIKKLDSEVSAYDLIEA